MPNHLHENPRTTILGHTQRVSDSNDHPVSVVVVSSLKLLHDLFSNFVWMFLGWTPTKFGKIWVLPLFFMELWVILCNFWPILKKYSIKPLTRNP